MKFLIVFSIFIKLTLCRPYSGYGGGYGLPEYGRDLGGGYGRGRGLSLAGFGKGIRGDLNVGFAKPRLLQSNYYPLLAPPKLVSVPFKGVGEIRGLTLLTRGGRRLKGGYGGRLNGGYGGYGGNGGKPVYLGGDLSYNGGNGLGYGESSDGYGLGEVTYQKGVRDLHGGYGDVGGGLKGQVVIEDHIDHHTYHKDGDVLGCDVIDGVEVGGKVHY